MRRRQGRDTRPGGPLLRRSLILLFRCFPSASTLLVAATVDRPSTFLCPHAQRCLPAMPLMKSKSQSRSWTRVPVPFELSSPRSANTITTHTSAEPTSTSTALSIARYDNLVSGIAEISLGFSLGVLWSEYAVITTSCGPLNFSDALERLCYQGVIVSAGASLFTRIVTGGSDLATYICEDYFDGGLAESTVIQVRAAEWLSILAVLGALMALAVQMANGEQMDGLSGINVELCRAVRDL